MASDVEMMMKLKSPEVLSDLSRLYGQQEGMLVHQAERYSALLKWHISQYGAGKPVMMISAPGRSEIGGNHTDHNNGKVLAAAITLDTLCAVTRREDMLVHLQSEGYSPITMDLTDTSVRADEIGTTASLIRGVAAGMKEKGYVIGGFDACVTSEVLSGSGLSSSAAFEVMMTAVFDKLFNGFTMTNEERARISQFAENVYFGKPSGLLDQMGSATGGLVYMDFKSETTKAEPVPYDFAQKGYVLAVVATGGSHDNLTAEYAAIPAEMKQVAAFFGKRVLREVCYQEFLQKLPQVRAATSDRAVLRAMHYFAENDRVDRQVQALRDDNVAAFLKEIISSGQSSFMYLQNLYAFKEHQELPVALCLAQRMLEGQGAWRVQGGGFAGTTLNFVPMEMVPRFTETMEQVFGAGSCRILAIRPVGAYCISLG